MIYFKLGEFVAGSGRFERRSFTNAAPSKNVAIADWKRPKMKMKKIGNQINGIPIIIVRGCHSVPL